MMKIPEKFTDFKNIGPKTATLLTKVGLTPATFLKMSPEDVYWLIFDDFMAQGGNGNIHKKLPPTIYTYVFYGAQQNIAYSALPEAKKKHFQAFGKKVMASLGS